MFLNNKIYIEIYSANIILLPWIFFITIILTMIKFKTLINHLTIIKLSYLKKITS